MLGCSFQYHVWVMRRFASICAGLLFSAGVSCAIGPHEVVLLVNGLSSNSVSVAQAYRAMRDIPEQNVITLDIHERHLRPQPNVSPAQFARLIWDPVNRAIRERGLDDHVLAWVYSTDFPTRVLTNPRISVQGLTFMRNRLPDPEQDVKLGRYRSPLFAGPDGEGGGIYESATFDVLHRWLRDEMPVPSMALGFTDERGNTVAEVMRCLERSAAADGTNPTGTVYFVVSDDVRSQCRQWQFKGAQLELESIGQRAYVVNEPPRNHSGVTGLQMGAARVDPENWGNVYLPGSMLEHLTSAGAVFDSANQTKLSAWIRVGASGSCGAVTEPFALWMKFPTARFYVHYVSGCSMIESFYQSIRCPLQLMLVGDPLVSPWRPVGGLIIGGVGDGLLAGTVRLKAVPRVGRSEHYGSYLFLVDGRVVGRTREVTLDTTTLEDGQHRVRAVAYRTGLVRQQVYDEVEVRVRNGE